jgi:5'-phosphate synthase pdxT subunit
MILLADRVLDAPPSQLGLGGIDMTVRRNAFGRQIDSFEEYVEVDGVAGGPGHAVFIRAPWVESVGEAVVPIARIAADSAGPSAGKIVAVRQQNLLATSFHPELVGDGRIHAYFCEIVRLAA